MSVMHFANALVWEIIGPAIAGPTGPCATPMRQTDGRKDILQRQCPRYAQHRAVKWNDGLPYAVESMMICEAVLI